MANLQRADLRKGSLAIGCLEDFVDSAFRVDQAFLTGDGIRIKVGKFKGNAAATESSALK